MSGQAAQAPAMRPATRPVSQLPEKWAAADPVRRKTRSPTPIAMDAICRLSPRSYRAVVTVADLDRGLLKWKGVMVFGHRHLRIPKYFRSGGSNRA